MIGLASADVANEFRKARIEPNVINEAPTELLEVYYQVLNRKQFMNYNNLYT